jgi:hypothetical protein
MVGAPARFDGPRNGRILVSAAARTRGIRQRRRIGARRNMAITGSN